MTKHETLQERERLEAENRRTYPVIWGFALAGLVGGAVILAALLAGDDWLLDRPVPSIMLTALSVTSMVVALVLLWGCHRRAKRLLALHRTKEYTSCFHSRGRKKS